MSARLARISTGLAVLVCLGGFGVVSAAAASARTIVYHPRDVVPLRARVHYSTLIVLPDGDDVVEVTCGDKELWIVNVRGGLVSVKPTRPGSETNLNLVTTTGQVYAFLLTEVSADRTQETDLTVYLEPDQPAPAPALAGQPGILARPELKASKPKFVSAEQLEDFRAQAELAREQARQANEEARRATEQARTELESALTAFRRSYPLTLQFDYRFKADSRPFFLQAMFHDDHRTFIRSAARELPTVYEFKDGQPNLVNFDVQQGIYVIPKVLEDGYLMIGKAQIGFRRVDGGAR